MGAGLVLEMEHTIIRLPLRLVPLAMPGLRRAEPLGIYPCLRPKQLNPNPAPYLPRTTGASGGLHVGGVLLLLGLHGDFLHLFSPLERGVGPVLASLGHVSL